MRPKFRHWFSLVCLYVSAPLKVAQSRCVVLVAPYCSIPRDYLSDTPVLRAMRYLVSQHGQLGAIPHPPCLSDSPLESTQSGGAIHPPPSKGVSQRYLCDILWKQGKWVRYPLCDTISKGCCAIWGGISHWAAKCVVTCNAQYLLQAKEIADRILGNMQRLSDVTGSQARVSGESLGTKDGPLPSHNSERKQGGSFGPGIQADIWAVAGQSKA